MHIARRPARAAPARVPPDSRVYAVGDIHGRADLLERLLALIAADAATSAASRRVVVFLGDYIDRGPESSGVIERLAAGPPPGFAWVFLKGNHEDMMLRFLAMPAVGLHWLANGGAPTLISYLGGPLAHLDTAILRDRLDAALPATHRRFLAGLALTHAEGGYLFVHAGLRPGLPLERQDEQELLWIRDPFLRATTDFGRVVVHGHSITDEPETLPNRIGIDTGAYYSDRLTALVLEGASMAFLQT